MDFAADPRLDSSLDAVKRHIVQAALAVAEREGSWDAVHVHAVAREAGITLEELHSRFGDKDAIAEGLFDFADAALLATNREDGWTRLSARQRLHRAIMAWLDTLAPHRRLVRGMLGYKLHPEHLHLQARGVARISRTVQWIREVSVLPSAGWRREFEEAVLTTVYLATFAFWLADSSPDARRTRRMLDTLLARAERGAAWLGYRG